MKFGKKKDGVDVDTSKKEKKDKKDKRDKKKDTGSTSTSTTTNSTSSSSSSTTPVKHGKVFGAPLPEGEEIPSIIIQTIDYLEQYLKVSGLFRESGSQQLINQYKMDFENDKHVDFEPHEPHVVANVLKSYLRELQDPLLGFDNYDMFVACESINDESVKLEVVKKVIKLLPIQNIRIIKYLMQFLTKVVAHSEHNRMTPDSLSIVFLPTILRPRASDRELLQFTVEDSKSTKTLMSTILNNYEAIFEDPTIFVPRTRQTRAVTEFSSASALKQPMPVYQPLTPPIDPVSSSTLLKPPLLLPIGNSPTTTPINITVTNIHTSPDISPNTSNTTNTTNNNEELDHSPPKSNNHNMTKNLPPLPSTNQLKGSNGKVPPPPSNINNNNINTDTVTPPISITTISNESNTTTTTSTESHSPHKVTLNQQQPNKSSNPPPLPYKPPTLFTPKIQTNLPPTSTTAPKPIPKVPSANGANHSGGSSGSALNLSSSPGHVPYPNENSKMTRKLVFEATTDSRPRSNTTFV